MKAAMTWMGAQHVRYPDFLVAPPKIGMVTGFWSLLFWALLPMVIVTFALLIYAHGGYATENNIWFGTLLIQIWPFTIVGGKWFEKCYGCWHIFDDMADWEDIDKRRWCGMWVTLCGGITLFILVVWVIFVLSIGD